MVNLEQAATHERADDIVEADVTEIREAGFSLDLPGAWERAEAAEPGSFGYREEAGSGTATVMLLAVRPLFAIADRGRLHSDYMQHRSKFERGRRPSLVQSDPVAQESEGTVEGSWSAYDAESGRRQLHRVMLLDNVLADFCLEAAGLDETEFQEWAERILETATVAAAQ